MDHIFKKVLETEFKTLWWNPKSGKCAIFYHHWRFFSRSFNGDITDRRPFIVGLVVTEHLHYNYLTTMGFKLNIGKISEMIIFGLSFDHFWIDKYFCGTVAVAKGRIQLSLACLVSPSYIFTNKNHPPRKKLLATNLVTSLSPKNDLGLIL